MQHEGHDHRDTEIGRQAADPQDPVTDRPITLGYAPSSAPRPQPSSLLRLLVSGVSECWDGICILLLVAGMIAIPAWFIDNMVLSVTCCMAFGVGVYYGHRHVRNLLRRAVGKRPD